MRRRGVLQAHGNKQELEREQQACRNAGKEKTVAHGQALAFPQDHDEHQCSGGKRAQADLHHRSHPRRGKLHRHLLQSPQHAEHQHRGDGEGIEGLALHGHVEHRKWETAYCMRGNIFALPTRTSCTPSGRWRKAGDGLNHFTGVFSNLKPVQSIRSATR
jgi:hypothetical protein